MCATNGDFLIYLIKNKTKLNSKVLRGGVLWMARKRDPKRDEAFEIYKEANGKIDLVEIAKILELSPGTIRGWKSKDSWEQKMNGTFRKKNAERSKRGGAPKGNQNAKGNKGNSRASPPKKNKNAVKTGEYETIFADQLTDEEKDLYSNMDTDPFFVLSEEINILRIRQRRMMQRIAKAEQGLNDSEVQMLYELRGRKKCIESQGRKVSVGQQPELIMTEKKEKATPKIETILRLEDALTRVSNQLVKALRQQADLSLVSTRKELMKAQVDYTKAQTTKALINKDGDETDGGTVINIIDDIG